MAQHEGLVQWFSNTKGHGFLRCEGERDLVLHPTAIQDYSSKGLKEGDSVRYDVIQGEKAPQADKAMVLRN